jgi:hypothetical protein
MVVVSKLFKWRLFDVRSVILGILLWTFLFGALSVVVGCVSNYLTYFFFAFTALSVGVVVWWALHAVVHRGSFRGFKLSLSLGEVALIAFVAVL